MNHEEIEDYLEVIYFFIIIYYFLQNLPDLKAYIRGHPVILASGLDNPHVVWAMWVAILFFVDVVSAIKMQKKEFQCFFGLYCLIFIFHRLYSQRSLMSRKTRDTHMMFVKALSAHVSYLTLS